MSKAHLGHKPSDETRNKMKESQKARWAKIKGEV